MFLIRGLLGYPNWVTVESTDCSPVTEGHVCIDSLCAVKWRASLSVNAAGTSIFVCFSDFDHSTTVIIYGYQPFLMP